MSKKALNETVHDDEVTVSHDAYKVKTPLIQASKLRQLAFRRHVSRTLCLKNWLWTKVRTVHMEGEKGSSAGRSAEQQILTVSVA